MKLLDHTKNQDGYTVRIWLDEIAPDCIIERTWAPYKSDDSEWDFTEKKYQEQQVEQAMKLAAQTLQQLNPTEVVVTQDKTALKAQQDAVDALAEENNV